MKKYFDLSLYLVTDRELANGRELEWIVSEAVKGGVTMVQLREKECSTEEFIAIAKRVKSLLLPLGIPLIINDRLDVTIAIDADGIHIGQSDLEYQTVRKILGKEKIIGLSVESMDDIIAANQLDVDYIGISPIFATETKKDTKTPFGLDGLREAVRKSIHPTVAIGGINRGNIDEISKTGVCGAAVVSSIISAYSPCNAARELKTIIETNSHTHGHWFG